MKMKRMGLLFLVVIPVLALTGLSSCLLFGAPIPSELKGSWIDENHMDTPFWYVETFTFKTGSVTYQFTDSDGTTGYTSDIVKVYTDRDMLKTEEPMYFSWHIDGSTLYLNKTNPEDPEPDLPDFWWEDAGIAKFTLIREE